MHVDNWEFNPYTPEHLHRIYLEEGGFLDMVVDPLIQETYFFLWENHKITHFAFFSWKECNDDNLSSRDIQVAEIEINIEMEFLRLFGQKTTNTFILNI